MFPFSGIPDMTVMQQVIEFIAEGVEIFGVLVTIVGLTCAVIRFIRGTKSVCFCKNDEDYRQFRSELGRSLLIGLEFLVAGDIIHTVAVQPSLDNLSVLGGLVILRFFLSIALELEIDGRFPWQRPDSDKVN
ncbi:MAG: DUF1622 domain-containing protein [Anaerolineae bacterium]|jgi:uncharacterized membrane protein|nr:DUF1622 domain-containing protein [Anaerolineae bacterium]